VGGEILIQSRISSVNMMGLKRLGELDDTLMPLVAFVQ
jgi:hypothetical protein